MKMDAQKYRTMFPLIDLAVIRGVMQQHRRNVEKVLLTLYEMTPENGTIFPMIEPDVINLILGQHEGNEQKMLKTLFNMTHDNESLIGNKPLIPKSEAKDPTRIGQVKGDRETYDDIKHDNVVDSDAKQRRKRRSSCREESQPSRSRFSSTTSMKSTKHSSKKASYVQEKAYGKIDEVEDDIVTLCIHGGSKNVFCLLDKCNYANPGIGDPVLVNFARDTADEAFHKVLAVHKLHIAKGKVKGLGPTCGFIKVPKEEKDVYFMHDQCENGTPDVGTTVDVLYIRTKCKTHRATLVS
mmetsp:Transcript_42336/g.70615  ORF Transcript_42336/g.70615 Transcript_42336/m.70615 type:complete len:296 (+) Transcript_42336:82-969(+)